MSNSLLGFCNSILIGWLCAVALWLAWVCCERFSRRRTGSPNAATEALNPSL